MHAVVVGGGIAGLAAARALRSRAGAELRITVVESSPVLGGKLRTGTLGGIAVEDGAESFLARAPEGVELARLVGLGDDLVHPATASAGLWTRGRRRPRPPLPAGTVLGVPADLGALARSRVLTPRGVARAAADLVLPGQRPIEDVAVGALVRHRLGGEVADRLVDPLLGGVYAGRADALSLRATMPALADVLSRSLVTSARAVRSRGAAAAGQPVFAAIDGGLTRLVEALAARAGADVRLGLPVRELTRTASGWRLTVGETRAAELLDADAVVLAVPAPPAARLLAGVAPAAAAELRGIDYASVALVSLAWPAGTVPAGVQGSGFLVPAAERRVMKAATFVTRKWAHLAGGGLDVVRASVGRYGDEADLQRSDDELVTAVARELGEAVGLTAPPVETRVTRWGGALPQPAVGHLDRVARIRSAVAAAGDGLAVAGAAYDGVGIPACIRSGERAATAVGEWVDGRVREVRA